MADRTRRDFLLAAAGFSTGLLASVKFDAKEGLRVGQTRVSMGTPSAQAACGTGLGCSGGRGMCGIGGGCSGGGGVCGMGMGCHGR
jgi:hypothetical protein